MKLPAAVQLFKCGAEASAVVDSDVLEAESWRACPWLAPGSRDVASPCLEEYVRSRGHIGCVGGLECSSQDGEEPEEEKMLNRGESYLPVLGRFVDGEGWGFIYYELGNSVSIPFA